MGRAATRAPRLIELNWGRPKDPRLVIVGKGVCFDSGGLDIKGADGMRLMKKDMGGAANALGLAQMVMALGLPVRLQLLIPAVENAIAGNAYRPGDVFKTRAGLHIEIGNTDAEGRVVLCDALAYGAEGKPALMIDLATLTGAARVALGAQLPALFCRRMELARALVDQGLALHDPLWHMPLWRGYHARHRERHRRHRQHRAQCAGRRHQRGAVPRGLRARRPGLAAHRPLRLERQRAAGPAGGRRGADPAHAAGLPGAAFRAGPAAAGASGDGRPGRCSLIGVGRIS